MNIAIIDYNSGNLKNLLDAVRYIGFNPEIITESSKSNNFDAIILPGVGAFGSAMDYIKNRNLDEFVIDFVKTGKNVLGICLGFQILFQRSYENGIHDGLGLLKGEVLPFYKKNNADGYQLNTHMGWNNVRYNENDKISSKLFSNKHKFYFLHTCFASSEINYPISALTNYNDFNFLSFVKKDNLIGVQFHPEKSREHGVNLLKNLLAN